MSEKFEKPRAYKNVNSGECRNYKKETVYEQLINYLKNFYFNCFANSNN